MKWNRSIGIHDLSSSSMVASLSSLPVVGVPRHMVDNSSIVTDAFTSVLYGSLTSTASPWPKFIVLSLAAVVFYCLCKIWEYLAVYNVSFK